MTNLYDVIIIGGGHNGLVSAAYLAMAGKRVVVLEASDQLGGAAITRPLTDGVRVSAGAHYLNQLSDKVAKELELEKHGLTYAAKDLGTIALSEKGHIHIKGDKLSGVIEKDTDAYKAFKKQTTKYCSVLNFLLNEPPMDIFEPDTRDKMNAFKLAWKLRFGMGAETMSEFLRQVGMNIYDVMDDTFDDHTLMGAICFDATLGTHTGPRSPGSMFTYLYRNASGNKGAIDLPKGGMGTVSAAIAKAAEAAGAELRVGARVKNVIVDNCAVKGVTLENDEVISSNRVVSNVDPKTTVLALVGARHFEADFVHRINHIRMRGTTAKLHLALADLPKFKGVKTDDLKNRLIISGSQDSLERAFNHVKYKEASTTPAMEIIIPSIHDDTLCEKGHVLSANVQYAPYDLKGGWTAEARETFLERAIDRIATLAPNIRDQITYTELLTPKDLEEIFGMTGGNWHHGELTLDQMLMLRPVPLASRYALPLKGLYICGAGAHPGGGVMGAAGRNAARVILKGGEHD